MPEPILLFQACLLLWSTFASWVHSVPLKRADCPGYKASNVQQTDNGITADLTLAGSECNVHGKDLKDLKFLAEFQTGMIPLHYLSPRGCTFQEPLGKRWSII
jgi:alpha-glucosidase